MPTKAVDAFFEKVATDKKLQAKLKKIHQGCLKETKAAKEAASGEVVKIAAGAGFAFKVKDLMTAKAAKAGKAAKAEVQDVTGQWMDCSGGTYNYCTAQNWSCIGYSYY